MITKSDIDVTGGLYGDVWMWRCPCGTGADGVGWDEMNTQILDHLRNVHDQDGIR